MHVASSTRLLTCSAYASQLSAQVWADEQRLSFTIESAKIEGRTVSYPYLLDEKGEPRLESTNDFLVWFCERCDIVTKKSVVEKAESWLKACGDLSRAKFNPDGPGLRKGIFTEAMRVRVAIKGHAEAFGASAIASGKEVAARADNLLNYDQMTAMMHRAYAADQAIHGDPLRCLQTGVEVRITHQAGCRGQIVRSANWSHAWLHDYDMLADGSGINGVTLFNNSGDKTHTIGEGSHFGWMPNINVLLCPSVALGTCALYRFTARHEAFPDVCADNGGANPGYKYKWLPLLIATANTYEVDADKAQLEIHGVGKKSQSTCFKQLYAVSGVASVTGDAIEHVGRAQAQQEAQNAGVDSREVEEALGYEHSAKKDHYTPQIPLSFQLQRAGLPWTPEKRALVDAVQFRVLREKGAVVAELVDLAVPALLAQDATVAAIADLPEDPSSHREVAEARRANRDSHKREHLRFLAVIREEMSLAIVGAACRPRNRKGDIMYDSLSLIQQHGKERLYKGIRIPVGGTSYGDTWLFDHPLFKQIQTAVTAAEEDERVSASAAEQARVRSQAAAIKEVMAPELQAATDAGKAAIQLANAIPVAAGRLSMCAMCQSGNLAHWMKCCVDLSRENIGGLMNGWSGSCPCRTVFGATNSRCRMLADSLRFRRNADFWRIFEVWGEQECRQHAGCTDTDGSTLLHLGVDHCDSNRGDILIVETILDWGVPLEAKNRTSGTALARAIEMSHVALVCLLIARGADRLSPCTPGGVVTPLELAQRTMNAEIIALVQDGPPSPTPAAASDDPPATSKRQKLSKDGGDGIPHAYFGSFGKSVRKLWEEYTAILRQRNRDDTWWYGKGPQSRASRNFYHRKCVWYREIARRFELNSSDVDAALRSVQAFADPYFRSGGGGWEAAEKALRQLTPADGTEAGRLTAVYESI